MARPGPVGHLSAAVGLFAELASAQERAGRLVAHSEGAHWAVISPVVRPVGEAALDALAGRVIRPPAELACSFLVLPSEMVLDVVGAVSGEQDEVITVGWCRVGFGL